MIDNTALVAQKCGAKLVPKCTNGCLNEFGTAQSGWMKVCPQCSNSMADSDLCRKWPVKGKIRCELHGGLTPIGEQSVHARHLRYSNSIPRRLMQAYDRSQNDPDKLVLDAEIAVVDARIEDLLKRVDSGESGKLWIKLGEQFDLFLEARNSKDSQTMLHALEQMHKLIKQGKSDYAAWNEIGKKIDQRKRLVESERRRLVEAQQVITVDKLFTLLGAIENIMRENIDDQTIIQAIGQDISRLLS